MAASKPTPSARLTSSLSYVPFSNADPGAPRSAKSRKSKRPSTRITPTDSSSLQNAGASANGRSQKADPRSPRLPKAGNSLLRSNHAAERQKRVPLADRPSLCPLQRSSHRRSRRHRSTRFYLRSRVSLQSRRRLRPRAQTQKAPRKNHERLLLPRIRHRHTRDPRRRRKERRSRNNLRRPPGHRRHRRRHRKISPAIRRHRRRRRLRRRANLSQRPQKTARPRRLLPNPIRQVER